jgi:hypothetical protein
VLTKSPGNLWEKWEMRNEKWEMIYRVLISTRFWLDQKTLIFVASAKPSSGTQWPWIKKIVPCTILDTLGIVENTRPDTRMLLEDLHLSQMLRIGEGWSWWILDEEFGFMSWAFEWERWRRMLITDRENVWRFDGSDQHSSISLGDSQCYLCCW